MVSSTWKVCGPSTSIVCDGCDGDASLEVLTELLMIGCVNEDVDGATGSIGSGRNTDGSSSVVNCTILSSTR